MTQNKQPQSHSNGTDNVLKANQKTNDSTTKSRPNGLSAIHTSKYNSIASTSKSRLNDLAEKSNSYARSISNDREGPYCLTEVLTETPSSKTKEGVNLIQNNNTVKANQNGNTLTTNSRSTGRAALPLNYNGISSMS